MIQALGYIVKVLMLVILALALIMAITLTVYIINCMLIGCFNLDLIGKLEQWIWKRNSTK